MIKTKFSEKDKRNDSYSDQYTNHVVKRRHNENYMLRKSFIDTKIRYRNS